ncbi:MAG TPA: hypothetical protein VGW38_25010 [Chloroflexota bacterium]|nr:hypothetical protein [Chloroflexota bacterium]
MTTMFRLRAEGHAVLDEDVERLSSPGYDHVNLLRHYHFSLADAVALGFAAAPGLVLQTWQSKQRPALASFWCLTVSSYS